MDSTPGHLTPSYDVQRDLKVFAALNELLDGPDSVEDLPDPNHFIAEYSSQVMLSQVCETLGLDRSTWSLLFCKHLDGEICYMYDVSVEVDGSGVATEAAGKYARTHEDARESAVLNLLCQLCDSYGKTIKDYNYHKVKDMEQLLCHKEEAVTLLQTENELLKGELRGSLFARLD